MTGTESGWSAPRIDRPRQGDVAGRLRPEKVLFVCGYDSNSASTVSETATYIQRFSQFPITVFNVDEHRYGEHPVKFPPSLDLDAFAAVVFHSTMSYHPENLIEVDTYTRRKLRDFRGLKVLMKQDDNHKLHKLRPYIKETGFDLVLTVLPPEAVPIVYPAEIVGPARFERMLTGYVTPTLRGIGARLHERPEARPIDIGYRGSVMPLWFGRLCYEKHRIGTDVARRLAGSGLRLDISSRAEDRFGGESWFNFLLACKATLGTESGSSVFDLDGDLARRVEAIEGDLGPFREDEAYAEAYLSRLADLEDVIDYAQVSPRHFEAAACQTLQLLHPGAYSGIFVPDRHYVPLAKDCSNLGEAVALLQDDARRRAIVEAAYDEIVCDRRYWIETFVEQLDRLLLEIGREKGVVAAPARGPARRRILALSNGDPWADARVARMERFAPDDMLIHHIGTGGGSALRRAELTERGSVRLRTAPSAWTGEEYLDWSRQLPESAAAMAALRELTFIQALLASTDEALARAFTAPHRSPRIAVWRDDLRKLLDTTRSLFDAASALRGVSGLVVRDLDALPAGLLLRGLFDCAVLYDVTRFSPERDGQAQEFEVQFWRDLERRLIEHVAHKQAATPFLAAAIVTGEEALCNVVPDAEIVEPGSVGIPARASGACAFLFVVSHNRLKRHEPLVALWPELPGEAILHIGYSNALVGERVRQLARTHVFPAERLRLSLISGPDDLRALAASVDVGLIAQDDGSIGDRFAVAAEIPALLSAGVPMLVDGAVPLSGAAAAAGWGEVVNLKSRDRVSDAVARIAADSGLRARMGAAAERYFRERWNWIIVARGFYDCLNEMVRSDPQRDLTGCFGEWRESDRALCGMAAEAARPCALVGETGGQDCQSGEVGMLNVEKIRASTDYWTQHNVTAHHAFTSRAESVDYLAWRTTQYLGYDELMPVEGWDGLTILDFGCGPGHDLVGFGTRSKPGRLIGLDVSTTSLEQAAERLKFHDIAADLMTLDAQQTSIDLPDASVDLVHCSGVLHHLAHPELVIREFRRVLKPSGTLQVMVYNRDSVWFHLYVPYILMIEEGQFAGLDIDDAFRRSTDGIHCPISRSYTQAQFQGLAEPCGFALQRYDVAVSCLEMIQLPKRFNAIMDRRLTHEHRSFLADLTLDERGLPLHRGKRAGIDGCYRFGLISGAGQAAGMKRRMLGWRRGAG